MITLFRAFTDGLASGAYNGRITKAAPTRRLAPDLIAPDGRTDERLGRIVHLLTENAMVVVSGTKIADEIGITRSAVWRYIEQLRALGVEIVGHPATGYRLEKMPDLLLPEVLAPLLRGTRFADIHHYFRISSTNTLAMNAAAEGAREGSVYLAEEQTAGRGRSGHDWLSARSAGIYASVILRPNAAPADILALSLAAGLAAAAAVEHVTGLKADLRWPNDLLLGDKKFCGILAEMNAEATRVRYAVVGIGMNVNHTEFPAALADTATSLLLASGQPWSRVDLAAALLKSLDREYTRLARGTTQVVRRFEAASSFAHGRHVAVDEEGGFEGTTDGLDSRGFLRIRTPQGVRTVLSGGVRAVG